VDAQVISVATAVASAAVAALGLLLSWYRREASKEERREERRSRWFFIAAAVGIVGLAAVGVGFTFVLGASPKSSVAGISTSIAPSKLTEAQYRGKVGPVCTEAKEKGRRLEEVKALETIIGSEVKIEQEAVEKIDSFQPPDKLKSAHDDMVSVWKRRVSVLDSIYHRLSQLSDRELDAELAVADRLAEELAKLFKSLGVPECIL
jgi:hypothetical protein